MYTVNGAYGQIRVSILSPTYCKPGTFWMHWAGWHRCNDLYHVYRAQGHEHHLILITTKGRGLLRIRNQEFQLTPGSIALLPRNVAHSYQTPQNGIWEFYWIHPAGDSAASLFDSISAAGLFVVSTDHVSSYVQHMEQILILSKALSTVSPYSISMELSHLYHDIAKLFDRSVSPSLPELVMAYLQQHVKGPVRLEDVAASLHISVSHLIRVFREETGCTPHQYLIQQRLSLSRQLLRFTNIKTDEIAAATGFSSASHFVRVFRKQFGLTPGQYRKQGELLNQAEEQHPDG